MEILVKIDFKKKNSKKTCFLWLFFLLWLCLILVALIFFFVCFLVFSYFFFATKNNKIFKTKKVKGINRKNSQNIFAFSLGYASRLVLVALIFFFMSSSFFDIFFFASNQKRKQIFKSKKVKGINRKNSQFFNYRLP